LFDLISGVYPHRREALEPMRVHIEEKRLGKNKLLRRGGTVCKDMYYIKSGGCYMYVLEGEKELVTQFFFEGELMTDHFSFLTGRPSNQFIRTLEDTRLESLSYDSIQQLYDKIPGMERVGRVLTERACVRLMASLASYKNDSAETRYRKLLQRRPELSQRAPQYLIASYLGITPVGLSKIRRRLFRSGGEVFVKQG
jgi:CRP-like cAMP-binding protein